MKIAYATYETTQENIRSCKTQLQMQFLKSQTNISKNGEKTPKWDIATTYIWKIKLNVFSEAQMNVNGLCIKFRTTCLTCIKRITVGTT